MKLSGKEKAAYGLGAVGKDMVYMLSSSYVLYYYQDILGVSAIAMGVILMGARIFDAFNDPFMGVLVAKTKTRWGRFRPWLFLGTVTNAVLLYLLFSAPPALTGSGLIVYAAVTYILWGVTYTIMDIPFWSMIPAFTDSGKEREDLSTLGRTCAGVGSALISVVTMMCVYALGQGDERTGFSRFALIVAFLFLLFVLTTVFCIKEKSTVDVETSSVGDMFRSLFKNDQAIVIVITIVLVNTALYVTSNLVIYYFKYDFGGADWYASYTWFYTFGGAIQILAMMLFFPFLRRFCDTIRIFYISCGMAIAGFTILLVLALSDTKILWLLFIPGFLVFAGFGMLTVLVTIFLANTVDYGEVKNGSREESVIFSMQTFVVKLASGLAAMISSICLTICNLSSDTSEGEAILEAGSSLTGLRLTMTILPMIGFIIAIIIFRRKYILTDTKMKELTEELHEKHAGEG